MARVRGIPVRLHFTMVIAFLLIAWTLAGGLMQVYVPGLTAAQYWLMGAAGAVVLFFSVFLHELMHSIVAMRYGIKVRQITLFIFGGVSEITEETRDFRKEFNIAIAGPVTSFAVASVLATIWWPISSFITDASPLALPKQMAEGVLLYGAIVNALVGGFNLIPAFPLDGGRVLRAALIRQKRSYDDATRIAARVGVAISYGFMGLGFFIMLAGSFISGIWLLLIGWFLNSGAQSYLVQHELSSALSGVRLRDIMNTRVITVREDIAVDQLLRDYFGAYMKSAFPVVDASGRLLGMVMLKSVTGVADERRQHIRAGDIMIPAGDLAVMAPDRRADEALQQMTRTRVGKVFVCDAGGRLLGLVSKTDIMNVASEREEYRKELGAQRRPAADSTTEAA
ncbi:putative zinc metalloprotease [Candidatus Nitrososphaera gargensis Ga9.2]|uniref:Zinc metalloprotease n=1 Tax=Nitrososphaera gargensis (strain Ga9.2) TaxID=1237085 RepID=K0IF73_NITGG|nr:site-2 protease family protein [Candidatus Nitrososphaera gargensis]AFU60016.1 putative zinc metalloprotease [Candidatus Nitrososphaera gargensis Ga9.2]